MANPSSSDRRPSVKDDPAFCCNPFQCRCGRHRMPQRVVLALLLHLCLQNNFNTRVVLNVAIVEMVAPPEDEGNFTVACPEFDTPVHIRKDGSFPWPRQTKSLVLYAFYIGYTVTQVPGGWLSDKFGSRYIISGSVIVTTITTAIFPFMAIKFGHIAAVVLRFVLGAAHGPAMPAVSTLVSNWFPSHERPLWGGISYSGTNLGTILGNLITGVLIDAFNKWSVAFYFWSSYSGLFLILVILFLYSFPYTNPHITEEELDYITSNVGGTRSVLKKSVPVPWCKILLNLPYWANVAAQFGHNYIYLSLITYLPTYMKEILQFDVQQNGLFAAAPFIALWLTSLVLSATSHCFYKCMSELTYIRVFGAGTNVVSAALLLGAVYAGCNRVLCIVLYITSMLFKAFYYVTLPVNINALSRNFGGIMFGLCNAIGSLSGIIGNFIIGYVTKNRTIWDWKLVFWITFGITVFTTLIFLMFSSADRQMFDYTEDDPPP